MGEVGKRVGSGRTPEALTGLGTFHFLSWVLVQGNSLCLFVRMKLSRLSISVGKPVTRCSSGALASFELRSFPLRGHESCYFVTPFAKVCLPGNTSTEKSRTESLTLPALGRAVPGTDCFPFREVGRERNKSKPHFVSSGTAYMPLDGHCPKFFFK